LIRSPIDRAEELPIRFVTHVTLAIYLIEAGLVLVVAPWTEMWRRNYFVDVLPWLAPVTASAAARFVVVATGLATAVAGMTDLRAALAKRGGSSPPRGPLDTSSP
jgi:hypothetical protein